MKCNVIAITPPQTEKELLTATPELLASSLAKYSRSTDGIESILGSIDWENQDASIERIFKFIDYGHASIGGMTGGIAVALDDCSMFLAYKIFELSNLVDGQESSTRYIKMDSSSLPNPEDIGIPKEHKDEWLFMMDRAFSLYNKKYEELSQAIKDDPSLIKYPDNASEKVKIRLQKNYALDRARYLIPFATKTSAAYIMTARVWANVIKELASLPIKECNDAANIIRDEVSLVAPKLMKHSYPDEASLFHQNRAASFPVPIIQHVPIQTGSLEDKVWVSVDDDFSPFFSNEDDSNFDYKENRYSEVGSTIKRTAVRFAINNIAIAELRDLNRHRTGYKFTDLKPVGFYLPQELRNDPEVLDFVDKWGVFLQEMTHYPTAYNNVTYMYSYLLGTQVSFEQSTHLDKLIYEIELRTGMGAHFRYAEHLSEIAKVLGYIRPQYEQFINIGTAEPE